MNIEDIKHIRNTLRIGISEARQLLEDHGTVTSAIKKWKEKQAELLAFEKNKKYISFKNWFYIKDFFIECSQRFFNDNETIPNKIKPLTENYSKKLWNNYVSEKHRHLMMVTSDDDWKIKNLESFVNEWSWETSWNENDEGAFEKNVKHRLDWDANDMIYFFWGRYTGAETNWETLYKYWIPFMYEDEMNIVVNPKSKKVLVIGVHGSIAIGERIQTTKD
ncbi:DUF2947 family protein [Aquimarina sp. TRL1]|uniref:DUF2947 family protein n=1 Tax=Aquimarina sp. (strain TRL1) TaxID=2736252 RepID=UPI00158A2130|nr:DUF2947 family protein [Aquimarina sp. TRL1]QKX04050.1 DUF2947 family protein [Aquimarina sp. TRL1]